MADWIKISLAMAVLCAVSIIIGSRFAKKEKEFLEDHADEEKRRSSDIINNVGLILVALTQLGAGAAFAVGSLVLAIGIALGKITLVFAAQLVATMFIGLALWSWATRVLNGLK